MKVLILSPVHPCPPDRGSKIRIYHSVKRLLRRHDVFGLAFQDPDSRGLDEQWKNDSVSQAFESCGTPRGKLFSALRSIALGTTYRGAKFHDRRFRRRLMEVLKARDFDLIWVHFLNMLHFARDGRVGTRLGDTSIILDQHNDEEHVWKSHYKRGGIAQKLFARWNIAQVQDLRSRVFPHCDVVLSVSEEDAQATRSRVATETPVWVAPNGVDLNRFDSRSEAGSASKRLLFVGSMDVTMNVEAVTWFARNIFPRVRRKIPEVKFQIVGRNPTSEVRVLDRKDGISVTGGVESVVSYYEQAAVAVVPLQRGGGTKLKVPEAMAAQVPVVATSVGAQGLNVENGIHLRIADEADAFADATIELLRNREKRAKQAQCAYDYVNKNLSWAGIYDKTIRRIENNIV